MATAFFGNVAAIDFGTTFCSLSYQVAGYERENLMISDTYDRVPTALLVKRKGVQINVVEIGYAAQAKYKNITRSSYRDYLYFECFKMQLRDESKLSRETLISAFSAEKYYIFEVITLVLQHLRTVFEKHLSMSPYELGDRSKLTASDFQWVLTVPAIWKNRGKQMMREAAYKAGLLCCVPQVTAFTDPSARLPLPNIHVPFDVWDKLVLALEPECAALYCQEMTNDMVAKYCASQGDVKSNCYMVLDIGGGTVDIAVYDLKADIPSTCTDDSSIQDLEVNNTMNSVLPPTGNDWGGTKVNKEFSHLLQRMVGDNGYEKFYNLPGNEASNKAVITNLVNQDFEGPKINFGEDKTADDDEMAFIRLDPVLAKFYEQQLTSATASRYGVQYEDDTIMIPYSKMEELFQPAVSGILSCMNLALSDSPVSIDTIYLVGGFGGCPYIYRKVKAAVEQKNIRVVVPRHHRTAVAEGAVIFRQKPSDINSRVSDAYYGISTTSTYDPTKHEVSRRYYFEEDDCYKVDNCFEIFINKHRSVKFDGIFENTVYPLRSTQKKVSVPIYCTVMDGVKYTRGVNGEPILGVEEIGELTLDAPICGLPKSKRNIEVEFLIGGTELRVKAVYGPTGEEEVSAKLNFLSS